MKIATISLNENRGPFHNAKVQQYVVTVRDNVTMEVLSVTYANKLAHVFRLLDGAIDAYKTDVDSFAVHYVNEPSPTPMEA